MFLKDRNKFRVQLHWILQRVFPSGPLSIVSIVNFAQDFRKGTMARSFVGLHRGINAARSEGRLAPPRLLLWSCSPNTIDICAIYLSSAGTNWIRCARTTNVSRRIVNEAPEEFETRHRRHRTVIAARFSRGKHYRNNTMVPWLCVPRHYKNKDARRARRDKWWWVMHFALNDDFRRWFEARKARWN